MTGQALLRALKDSTRAGQASLVLPVGTPVQAVLRPIASVEGELDSTDVRLLGEWRNRHVKSFLTEFVANEARTARWLTQTIHADGGKLLFMLDSFNGQRLGHLGLGFIDWDAGYGEADAIVSGGASPKGLMTLALQTLLRWAREQLGLHRLAVRVRSDNPAVHFYRQAGFVEQQRIALVASAHADGIDWVEDPARGAAEPSLVHMRHAGP
jgi:RimJ/RimL family protein N-acetyltransferase